MLKTLPFNAMRAFECVVRQRGFGRAAQELGVTQSSVSQHVKTLEEWTGRRLLIRGPRHTDPTPEGQLLADAITSGIGQITDVCEALRKKPSTDLKITVTCPPGFALNWLFPRLIHFDQAQPQIPVSISTTSEMVSFATGQDDIAIRYGMGGYSGLHVEKLMDERMFPVCAPSLLENGPALRIIDDLAKHTILLDDIAQIGGNPPTWQFWAEETGQALPQITRTRKFGQANMVVQAAISGLGVALGREPLVIDALQDGRLVRPFPEYTQSQFSYWFVCPKQALKSDRLQRFRAWLFQEVENHKLSADSFFH